METGPEAMYCALAAEQSARFATVSASRRFSASTIGRGFGRSLLSWLLLTLLWVQRYAKVLMRLEEILTIL